MRLNLVFERYENKRIIRGQTVAVKENFIYLPKALVISIKWKSVKYVSLFFDRDERKIGIQKTEALEDSQKLSSCGNDGMQVSFRGFRKFFGVTDIGRFHADYDEKANMLIITLNQQDTTD